MKGVVFTEFLDMVERRHGIEVLDDVLTATGIGHLGAYIAVGTYDWRDFARLAQALAERIDVPLPTLVRGYGQHLFGVFARSHGRLLEEVASAFDLLENVEGFVYPEVRKLYTDAELPRFDAERTEHGMMLRYRSERPFASFAWGLIEGCLLHFAVPAAVVMEGGDGNCTFSIVVRKG